ncbi:unnamed protein product [Tetraodon nigroviridis]|uniref:gluconokinase n=1 Tax=Tetraodon nigroviridis TaxID=99883 RepID=Q4SWQ7_TETNG|nr:unnamed protein product [Tetraodon nigroviridis]
MANGEPLTDQDRLPWLLRLHDVIESETRSGCDALLTCSALKRLYRQILLHGSRALTPSLCPDQSMLPSTLPHIYFLFLQGNFELLQQRILARRGHYMKADLLRSQFDALEPPLEEENVLLLDVSRNISDIAMEVEKHLIGLKSS